MAEDVDGRVGPDNSVPEPTIRRSPLKVRLIGENFDVSLRMTTAEDFEIAERILTREKVHALGKTRE